MKILRPFTGTGAVFWPTGIPPEGTCEFATSKCKIHCYASLPKYPDFDEEILIDEDDKRQIYQVMLTRPIAWLRDALISELDGLQTDILHWFGSGDCSMTNVDRVLEIIAAMDGKCTQMGFTRNVALWNARKDIFALSVESEEQINGRDGLFAVTDYDNGTSVMFFNGSPTKGGRCGPELCTDQIESKLTHFINCKTCRRMKTGCFDRKMKVK